MPRKIRLYQDNMQIEIFRCSDDFKAGDDALAGDDLLERVQDILTRKCKEDFPTQSRVQIIGNSSSIGDIVRVVFRYNCPGSTDSQKLIDFYSRAKWRAPPSASGGTATSGLGTPCCSYPKCQYAESLDPPLLQKCHLVPTAVVATEDELLRDWEESKDYERRFEMGGAMNLVWLCTSHHQLFDACGIPNISSRPHPHRWAREEPLHNPPFSFAFNMLDNQVYFVSRENQMFDPANILPPRASGFHISRRALWYRAQLVCWQEASPAWLTLSRQPSVACEDPDDEEGSHLPSHESDPRASSSGDAGAAGPGAPRGRASPTAAAPVGEGGGRRAGCEGRALATDYAV